jgi:hypothetical protein
MVSTNATDPMELLRELRVMAPDVWAGRERCLILPQKLGDFEKPEYLIKIRGIIRRLNEQLGMFNDGRISEDEYKIRRAEILFGMQSTRIR